MKLGVLDVHVWVMRLSPGEAGIDLRHFLDAGDIDRAAALKFAPDRRRLLQGHAARRLVLSRHLGSAVTGVDIRYADDGRPHLAADEYSISYSDSHEVAVLALCRGHDLGVDVEHLSDRVSIADVVPSFTARERALLSELPPEERRRACIRAWCRKEAAAKAFRLTLDEALRDADLAGEDNALWRLPVEVGRPWTVRDLPVAGGYECAVAAASKGMTLRIEHTCIRKELARHENESGRGHGLPNQFIGAAHGC